MKYYYNEQGKSFSVIDNFEYTPKEYEYEITQKQHNEYMSKSPKLYTKNVSVVDGKVVFEYILKEDAKKEEDLRILRSKRKLLLEAFDKWEKAVLRFREDDDLNIVQWYRDLLDLKESAFDNIPERIKYYM